MRYASLNHGVSTYLHSIDTAYYLVNNHSLFKMQVVFDNVIIHSRVLFIIQIDVIKHSSTNVH